VKPFPATDPFVAAAGRIIWFKSPVDALDAPLELMTYALKYATPADMLLLLSWIGPAGLAETLDNARPGIVDARSWSYWNIVAGRHPPSPLPQRRID